MVSKNKFSYFQEFEAFKKKFMNEIRKEVKVMPSTNAEMKAIVDAHYLSKGVSKEKNPYFKIFYPSSPSKKTVVRNITKNAVDYVKHRVQVLVNNDLMISKARVQKIIVKDLNLCSQSSFRSILNEMEKKGVVVFRLKKKA